MNIEKYEPMPTRPCKYCLSLQEGSVFADFDINQEGCLYLIRISFDGYGCCKPKIGIGFIKEKSSKSLISAIESNRLKSPEVIKTLKDYFSENKDFLWEDALSAHKLI